MAALRRSPRTLLFTALLAAFAVGAGIGLLAPQTADAVPAYGTHVKYYDTPACGNQVGYRYYDCDGVLQSSWGVVTAYSTYATYGCLID